MPTPRDPVDAVRALCQSLPDVVEVVAHGEPTFRVNGRMFVTFASPRLHPGAGRSATSARAGPGALPVKRRGAEVERLRNPTPPANL